MTWQLHGKKHTAEKLEPTPTQMANNRLMYLEPDLEDA